MHNSRENSNRRIENPMAGIAEPSLDLTLGPRNIPHKDQAPMVNVDLPLLPQQGPVIAVPPPSQSPPPNPGLHCSSAPASASSELLAGAAMANFAVDPVSFLPGDYEILHVDGRPQQCRYHVAGVITPRHEDLAIATITPDFQGDQPFALTRNYLRQFMEEETPFTLQISQRCPLGSAYIRVGAVADRDWLVAHSPFQFMGRDTSPTYR